MKIKGWVAALSLCFAGSASALTVDFDLTDWDSAERKRGSYANEYSYEVDGVSLSVTGWSSGGNKYNPNAGLKQARVGQWRGGLGVENNRGASHTVDNWGYDFDFLMFEFDTEVTLEGVGLGYIHRNGDSDVSVGAYDGVNLVSAGNIFNANLGLNDANPSNVASSTWLVGAFHPLFGAAQDDWWDGFKVNELSVSVSPVPLPAAFWFFASGLAALGVFRKKAAK